MLQKVGLLPASNLQQIPFAWAMYAREDADGLINSEGFKKTFSIDVEIDFVGVWFVDRFLQGSLYAERNLGTLFARSASRTRNFHS